MTSHDVVSFLRRTLKEKRIGHTGTLDPDATGVLPICIGPATRVAEYLTEHGKAYRAEMIFGVTTDTQDTSGHLVRRADPFVIPLSKLEQELGRFRGTINQLPPMTSAVSVQGKRLYELARMGIEVERQPRSVEVSKLELVDAPLQLTCGSRVLVDIECSKGTYVRTICHDLGEHLGVGAVMSYLLRTRSGPFGIEDSMTLEEVVEASERGMINRVIQPIAKALTTMPQYQVPDREVPRLQNGMTIPVHDQSWPADTLVLALNHEGIALAVCVARGGKEQWLKPHKVFA
ncbi:MAG: tRNA pseudouridine(55) synthase TruB [Bacillota bacterium]